MLGGFPQFPAQPPVQQIEERLLFVGQAFLLGDDLF
jgi:hypothetical protein